MKLYLFDRALYLLAGVLILIVSFIFFPPILAVIVGVLVFAFWGIICYRLVLLPVDLAFGRKTELLYFSTQLCLEELEFFKKKYICSWKFHNNKNLILIVPLSYSKEQIAQIIYPPHDRLLRVTYYPLSKILISYDMEIEK